MNSGEPKLLAQEIGEAGPRFHLGGDVLAVDRQCHWDLHGAHCHSHACLMARSATLLCSSSCAAVKALPASSLRTISSTSAERSASAASAAPGRTTGAPSSAPTTTRAVCCARSITAIDTNGQPLATTFL